MKTDGLTKTCGLIGNPVEHTLSPVIHNTLAEITGKNLVYVPFKVEAKALGDAVGGAFSLNIQGLNITVPHKEKVLPFLSGLDALAEKIGAVNTLVRTGDGYKGYNTDMPGLYRAMLSDGIRVDGEKVIILGAGGVARAVAVMLCDKAEKIYILNRTAEKAEAIAEEVNGYAGRRVAKALALSEYKKLSDEKYLAVQATNVGMYPHTEEAVITDSGFYKCIHTGYDLIYNPFKTRFMKMVQEAGGQAFCGLKMLLYQGIIAFELWNDCKISEAQADAVYERLKESI
ncbi:MAG: shikimate dehydrogenase [Lachnospiraceae bacterium]|nr:shikimate dehydrogenase [Lachnospiraceae bacterium]